MHDRGRAGEVRVDEAQAAGEGERDACVEPVVIESSHQVVVQGQGPEPGRDQRDRDTAPAWREPATPDPQLGTALADRGSAAALPRWYCRHNSNTSSVQSGLR